MKQKTKKQPKARRLTMSSKKSKIHAKHWMSAGEILRNENIRFSLLTSCAYVDMKDSVIDLNKYTTESTKGTSSAIITPNLRKIKTMKKQKILPAIPQGRTSRRILAKVIDLVSSDSDTEKENEPRNISQVESKSKRKTRSLSKPRKEEPKKVTSRKSNKREKTPEVVELESSDNQEASEASEKESEENQFESSEEQLQSNKIIRRARSRRVRKKTHESMEIESSDSPSEKSSEVSEKESEDGETEISEEQLEPNNAISKKSGRKTKEKSPEVSEEEHPTDANEDSPSENSGNQNEDEQNPRNIDDCEHSEVESSHGNDNDDAGEETAMNDGLELNSNEDESEKATEKQTSEHTETESRSSVDDIESQGNTNWSEGMDVDTTESTTNDKHEADKKLKRETLQLLHNIYGDPSKVDSSNVRSDTSTPTRSESDGSESEKFVKTRKSHTPFRIRFSKGFDYAKHVQHNCSLCEKVFRSNVDLQLHCLRHLDKRKISVRVFRAILPSNYDTSRNDMEKYLRPKKKKPVKELNVDEAKSLIGKYCKDDSLLEPFDKVLEGDISLSQSVSADSLMNDDDSNGSTNVHCITVLSDVTISQRANEQHTEIDNEQFVADSEVALTETDSFSTEIGQECPEKAVDIDENYSEKAVDIVEEETDNTNEVVAQETDDFSCDTEDADVTEIVDCDNENIQDGDVTEIVDCGVVPDAAVSISSETMGEKEEILNDNQTETEVIPETQPTNDVTDDTELILVENKTNEDGAQDVAHEKRKREDNDDTDEIAKKLRLIHYGNDSGNDDGKLNLSHDADFTSCEEGRSSSAKIGEDEDLTTQLTEYGTPTASPSKCSDISENESQMQLMRLTKLDDQLFDIIDKHKNSSPAENESNLNHTLTGADISVHAEDVCKET